MAMFRKQIADYRKKLAEGIKNEDLRILNGESMSEVEWFDHNFKGFFMGYKSRGTRLYRLLNRKLVKMSRHYAEALVFAIGIEVDGFTVKEYGQMLKYLTRKMSKFAKRSARVRVKDYDRNGKFYITVDNGSHTKVDYPIENKGDALSLLNGVLRSCTKQVKSFRISKDLRMYLDSFMVRELSTINFQVLPEQYSA